MNGYLFLFRGGEPGESPEANQQHMQKWVAWMDDLRKQGRLKGGEPLERAGKVLRGRKHQVTDGPYTESKDLVGGYLYVMADTIDQATEIAKGCPLLERDGVVEIRPIMKMSM
jgi:hypothetical protein